MGEGDAGNNSNVKSRGARTSRLRLRSSEEASVDSAEGPSEREGQRKPALRSWAAWGLCTEFRFNSE